MTAINHLSLVTHHRISVCTFVIFNAMILRNKRRLLMSTLANDRDQPPSAHDAQPKYDTADRRWVGWSNLLAFNAFDINAVLLMTATNHSTLAMHDCALISTFVIFNAMILINKRRILISTLANDRDQPPSAHNAQSKHDTADRRWVGWSGLLAFNAFNINAVLLMTSINHFTLAIHDCFLIWTLVIFNTMIPHNKTTSFILVNASNGFIE